MKDNIRPHSVSVSNTTKQAINCILTKKIQYKIKNNRIPLNWICNLLKEKLSNILQIYIQLKEGHVVGFHKASRLKLYTILITYFSLPKRNNIKNNINK